jgi:arsenate reductase-like glutaredoxin family protein
VEEFLSQKSVPFQLRDVMVDPITPEELWQLMHDANGRQLAPLTRVGRGLVMGYDPVRLGENLAQYPEAAADGVTVYGRSGDSSTQGVLDYLRERAIPATLVDVDREPMSRDELWRLLEIPGQNIRTPFTVIDGTVVLGNDRRRLEEVLASGR